MKIYHKCNKYIKAFGFRIKYLPRMVFEKGTTYKDNSGWHYYHTSWRDEDWLKINNCPWCHECLNKEY